MTIFLDLLLHFHALEMKKRFETTFQKIDLHPPENVSNLVRIIFSAQWMAFGLRIYTNKARK